jgi:myo-inositol 2-dehydrogenase/D-chiro-inositol 1-dehydrogenase
MTVNIGLIGAGMIGLDHAQRLNSTIRGVRLAAVADIDAARAATVAAPSGAEVFTDAAELIAAPDIDAVFVASIGLVHEEQVLAAIAAGKPVFCEKPLTPTADAARRIVEAESQAGRRFVQVGFMRRFDPGYLALKTAYASGELGDALLVHCAHRNPSVPQSYTLEMAINDSATHEIDILRWLLGEEITRVRVDRPGKRTKRAYPHLQDPLLVQFETTSGVRADDELFVNCGFAYDIRCEIVAEDGIAALTEQALVRRSDAYGVRRHIAGSCMERFAAAYDAEVQQFVDDVAAQRPASGPSSWDGYAVAAVCDAGVTSLHDPAGPWVDVTMAARPALYA